jgi:hypothetical protein
METLLATSQKSQTNFIKNASINEELIIIVTESIDFLDSLFFLS